MNDIDATPFYRLSPDTVIDAVESTGRLSDCRVLALNSYENRVYQVGIEESKPIVAKFYRPGRWSDATIVEEHRFTAHLAGFDLPVVTPLTDADGNTLCYWRDYRFALYPRAGGHPPPIDSLDTLYRLGQQLGRMHAAATVFHFEHRPPLIDFERDRASVDFIAEHFVSDDLREAYVSLTRDLLAALVEVVGRYRFAALSLHGDCHPGNILWRDDATHFLDFDDCCTGAAIQDLWMLLSGDRFEQEQQLSSILDGYEEFRSFDAVELNLVEALRSLRVMRQTAWIARRWEDPAFPKAFTWFDSPRYWSDHILTLREQFAALAEPPLRLL